MTAKKSLTSAKPTNAGISVRTMSSKNVSGHDPNAAGPTLRKKRIAIHAMMATISHRTLPATGAEPRPMRMDPMSSIIASMQAGKPCPKYATMRVPDRQHVQAEQQGTSDLTGVAGRPGRKAESRGD